MIGQFMSIHHDLNINFYREPVSIPELSSAEVTEDIVLPAAEEDSSVTLLLLHSDNSSGTESSSTPSSPDSPHTVSAPSYSSLSDSDVTSEDTNTYLQVHNKPTVSSFKLVGDNLDKTVRPRHETVDTHSSSLHYFHAFAVKDRCDTSKLADAASQPHIDLDSFSLDIILPREEDYSALLENYAIIAARIIQKHVPFFNKNVPRVLRHIRHCHSVEMSQKSDVVCSYFR